MMLPGYNPFATASVQQMDAMVEMIRQSKRPIVYAGGGIIAAGASPELRTFAEKAGVPVAMTVHGLGGFPSDHYLSLNMLGMHGTVYANYAINEADLLIALGVRFDDRVTGKVSEFAKRGKIIHVDIDPSEINKIKAARLPVVANVRDVLRELSQRLEAQPLAPGCFAEWLRQIDHWRHEEPLRYNSRDDAIVPQYAIQRLWQ